MTEHKAQNGGEAVYGRTQIVSIVNSVLTKIAAPKSAWERKVLNEMQELKGVIESLRQELRNVSASDISLNHIPGATDELDAVVHLTEDATNKIMNACDQVQSDMASLPADVQTRLQEQLTNIYEACTFQDITGQRITKVIAALKKIDTKTQSMMRLLEAHFPGNGQTPQTQSAPEDEIADNLMNGPQLPGEGISQDDIDRILAEMGKDF